ncbi:PREDICTED: molybdenum cofactor sulfurase-like [Camelina sativa]|uniref:Molybdenum cofactor sulfurase-like n=1 Tax=Camelina sativa TaxID=90675 RepID=A0ABM0V015_CAMSA|nr:PREDICTED: molybdenum cofactor sulfurase-like [Camelina sativa]
MKNSHFIQEACFNGCCSSPFSSHSVSEKPEELEFSVITTGASLLTQDAKFTSQESLPRLRTSFYDLITAFPDYLQTNQADHLRSTDYQNLSSSPHVFGQQQPLFSYSQFPQVSESEPDLNPSILTLSCKQVSSGKELITFASEEESQFQSRMRRRLTSFMNLDESEYHMILTQDRSSAFKIVAELYSFKTNPNLLTVYNYEDEAVEEMIRISEKKGVKPESAEFSWPSTEINSEKLKRRITKGKRRGGKRGLFVFPLQSLVTGASYSYSWMSLAHENEWHVLLDTSALGSKDMETLGLSLFQPDFLICSFTEFLGQDDPSGFGCLFVKKSISPALSEEPTNPANLTAVKAEPSRKWKTEYSEQNDHEDYKAASTSGNEIIEIESSSNEQDNKAMIEFRGLDHADSLGLILISRRSKSLTLWLIRALMTLQHPGSHEKELPLVKIYGPKTELSRGSSISFNVFDWQGEKVDPLVVERLAERDKIGLRCAYLHKIRIGNKRRSDEAMSLRLSVVSVRLGFMMNFEDVFKVWEFVSRFLDADFVEKEKWRKKALEKKTND